MCGCARCCCAHVLSAAGALLAFFGRPVYYGGQRGTRMHLMGGEFQGDFKSRFTSTTIKAVTLHKYDHQVHVLYFKLCFLTRPDTQVRRSSTASQASVFIYAFTQGPHQDRKHVYGKRFLPVLHLGHSQATYSALISWSKGMCI